MSLTEHEYREAEAAAEAREKREDERARFVDPGESPPGESRDPRPDVFYSDPYLPGVPGSYACVDIHEHDVMGVTLQGDPHALKRGLEYALAKLEEETDDD